MLRFSSISRLKWPHVAPSRRRWQPQTLKRLFTVESTTTDIIYVTPSTPHALEGQAQLDLVDGNDLLLQFAPSSVHVLPGSLDLEGFKSALARTLALFPTAAGRLKRTGDDWRIDLTPTPISLTLATSPSSTVIPPQHAQYVVQPSSHVLPYLSPVDLQGAIKGDDAPLVSFKITRMGDGRTVLGSSWNHVLGDGSTLTRFLHILSSLYSHPLSPPPLPPTFHKLPTTPSPALEPLIPIYTPHIQQNYPLEEVLERYGRETMETSMLDLEFDVGQMTRIWEVAKAGVSSIFVTGVRSSQHHSGAENLKITQQDALTAYLVTLHNRCLEEPIGMVMNLMDVRLRHTPNSSTHLYRHPEVAGSMTAIVHCSLEHTSGSIAAIARAVRMGTFAARNDPKWVETYLKVNGAQYVKGVKEDRFYMYPPKGAVLVNSLMGVDRNKLASFGFGARTQFYTDTSWERMFRVHPANPVRLCPGRNGGPPVWESSPGKAVVAFRVAHALKEQIMEMKDRDMAALSKGWEVDWIGEKKVGVMPAFKQMGNCRRKTTAAGVM